MRPRRSIKSIAFLCITALLVMSTACSNWEQTTFQVLSASSGTIHQAILDYNGATTRTTGEYNALVAAKNANNLAVQAFKSYWDVKVSVTSTLSACNKSTTPACTQAQADLNAAIAAVNSALLQLGPLVTAVKTLKTAPPGGIGTQQVITP